MAVAFRERVKKGEMTKDEARAWLDAQGVPADAKVRAWLRRQPEREVVETNKRT